MTRPIPDIDDPDFAPFWEGTAQSELRLVHCADCDKPRWPPRPICGWCRSLDFEWRAISPEGRLYTWTVAEHQTTPDIPAPYVVGIVEVHADPVVRMLGQVVCDPEHLRIGMQLTAQFDRVSDEAILVNWTSATPVPGDNLPSAPYAEALDGLG